MGSQHPIIEALHAERIAKSVKDAFRPGDTVRVHYKIIEGDKERIQVFQGTVIRRRRGGVGATFTVRKISFNNIGVERIFPTHSPRIDKVEVLARGAVRRSKLYFLRELEGKAARLKDVRDKAAREVAAETAATSR